MKASEYRRLDNDILDRKIKDLKMLAMNQKTKEKRSHIRREIAKIKTVMGERK